VYKVILHKNAIKFYRTANENLRERINRAIDFIAQNPHYSIHVKKLQGSLSSMHRYRISDLRILYEIHEDIKTVRIKTIDVRGNVYK
jgi:mRNA-degrading endonuclease RelE of RelBE toxin-antitoxin system